ncbi:uncharacterized protein LOC122250440 isoform X2 [Penaeus japonicus]|uniref:uncharacterized protein LOC122246219 isoform X2 n=1 Tax=Penaeus japonicus TaxID=27405 RepID=UPI001C71761F|nr:uncharacterized protein LOC122246219 isoform X2 [Penaeus japonicus]XP_042867779.1 uncharacterized protein LOC122250440 isoform X2 [Penaeus japonicus]
MTQRELMVSTKLQCVLHHLTSYETQEDGTSDGTLAMVEDDTVLHKLHTHIDLMLDGDGGGGYEWAQNVGLMNFVQTVLDPSVVGNPKNTGTVAFAIKILASIIKYEENIETFSEDKVLVHFLVILPSIRNDPSLASASLTLVKALIKDKAGLHWIIKNGLWEKMLLPCLRSPSMFVQREGVDLITAVMLLQIDTPHFSAMVKDLLIVSDKFCEIRQHVNGILSEEIRQSNICVLNIFKQIFLQTLGKSAVYSQLRNVGDISTRLLSIIKHKVPVSSVTRASDVLILNLLHRFQEKLMGYGIFEQFLLDSLCADILSLTKLLLENGYIESFLRSSVNAHKYWRILVNNLKESKNIDITSVESILIIITGFQLTPIVSLYRASLGPMFTVCPEKEKMIAKWNEELHSRINLKEENKNETAKLEKEIQKILEKDPIEALRLTVLSISSLISAADHLHLTTAVTVFQGLSFMLISHNYTTSPMSQHDGLQRVVIDGLRILVEKYNIDWRKSYVSVCLMGQLCDLVKMPGISTQVKVSILKAMNSCINGFIPPVMSMLVNSERMEENSVELMGKILTIYLGDTEWEVRDSALELLITCMKLAKEKYPYFVEWLLRYRLNDALLTALGDVEGYVRASALNVLANIIEIDKVWNELELENLPVRSLAAVLTEGEAAVRRSAINLIQALFISGKYEEVMTNTMVVPIIQHAAEDTDDEVRAASLEFIRVHIQGKLNKSGMVDGEFPTVTFSKGKITRLNKDEVRNRIHTLVTWICDCGYLTSLLTCLKDPVTSVASKALEIIQFIGNLITKYEIRVEKSKPKSSDVSHSASLSPKKEDVKEEMPSTKVVVAGIEVTLPHDASALDKIDRTINDILSSSALSAVSLIKRPLGEHSSSPSLDNRDLKLSSDDIPSPNPAIPLSSLLQCIEDLSHTTIKQDDGLNISNFISLLDDILLDGGQKPVLSDDQRLRDCY